MALVDARSLSRDRYEFQMLLGVDDPLRRASRAQGTGCVSTCPIGDDWYAYSLRRLRENPAIAGHVARAVLGLRAEDRLGCARGRRGRAA
jgi:proline dehydrogenase